MKRRKTGAVSAAMGDTVEPKTRCFIPKAVDVEKWEYDLYQANQK